MNSWGKGEQIPCWLIWGCTHEWSGGLRQRLHKLWIARLDLMNNNRKEHISWKFICFCCFLFYSLALYATYGLFLLIFYPSLYLSLLESCAQAGCRAFKAYISSTGGGVFRKWQDSSEGRDFGKFYEKTWVLGWIIYRVKAWELPQIHSLKHTHNTMAVIWEVREDSWAGRKRSGRVEGRGFIRGA